MGTRSQSVMAASGLLPLLLLVTAVAVCGVEELKTLDSDRSLSYNPGHPADDPHWFNVATLSDDDIAQIKTETEGYVKEGKAAAAVDGPREKLEAARLQQEAKAKEEALDRPNVNIEKESTAVAVLQQQLAMKNMALHECKTKKMHCTARLGEGTQGPDHRFADGVSEGPDDITQGQKDIPQGQKNVIVLGPGDIKFPRTTAQEDWDHKYKDVTPVKKTWQPDHGPIYDTKGTASQDYVEDQNYGIHPEDNGNQPGFKRPEDRVFKEDAHALAQAANETKALAVARTAKHLKQEIETVASASKVAVDKGLDLQKAKRDYKVASRIPLRKETATAIGRVEKAITKCTAELKVVCN